MSGPSSLTVVIPGALQSWKRTNDFQGRRLTDAKQRKLKKHIASCMWSARLLRAPGWELELPMTVRVDVYRNRIETATPDGDNYFKIIGDAGNGVLWTDDAQIVSPSGAHKWDARELQVIECTVVEVTPLELEHRREQHQNRLRRVRSLMEAR